MKSLLILKFIKINVPRIFQLNQRKFHNRNKIFLKDQYNDFSFQELSNLSHKLSNELLDSTKLKDLNGEKIGVYCNNNYSYLISLLAIWKANGTPMCLSKLYPINYLDYFLSDSKCKLIVNGFNSKENSNVALDELTKRKHIINFQLKENEFFNSANTNSNDELIDLKNYKNSNKDALILYTSGTSGPPKGVLHKFKSLTSSIETMIHTWKWSEKDSALSTLPLNHFSGLVYCLLTPYYIKAKVHLLPRFNAEIIWSKLLSQETDINLFIGVPTVFNQLIEYYNKNLTNKISKEMVSLILNKKMRIIGSGSAALNVKTYNEWFNLTNYKLLERYGMTEIGMAISNPYLETNDFKRVAGAVGRPCVNCKARVVDQNEKVLIESDETNDRIDTNDDIFGELQINGQILFSEYFNKTEQTKESFTKDGWFKTGDTAQFLRDLKIFKIVGRTTVDIIKSGGYKISALDVERILLSFPLVEDCAVMGLSDVKWGQRVFALLQIKKENIRKFEHSKFLSWCKLNLPKYSVPSLVETTDNIPRNQLGKVNKKELIKFYENKLI